MNIESLLTKISNFEELVIDSGFKRDVIDFRQSINQGQNQNLVFMKDLSQKVIEKLISFQNNSLDSDLKSVLRENEPFTSLNTLEELLNLNNDNEINGQQYFQKFNGILNTLQQTIENNHVEIKKVKETFRKYISEQEEFEREEDQALMSLIFKDLQSTGSLKEFSKVLHRWNRTLIMYHTLLKSDSPEEISLVEIQNGSIDVIFNIDFDIAIDLTDLIKTGLQVYGAYLLYKSNTAKAIIASYMGNKKLIEMESKREKLMLDNIKESIKKEALAQHKRNLKTDKNILKEGVNKKADEVAKVITDHIIKGNEVRLLTPPEPNTEDDENEENLASELREQTSIVRERFKTLNEKEKQLLLEKYSIKEEDDKKPNSKS